MIIKRLLIVAAATILLFVEGLFAQATKPCPGVKPFLKDSCDTFFTNLQKGKPEAAFARLLNYSPILTSTDQYKNIIDEAGRALEIYGSLRSFELINCESVGERLARLSYLSAHVKTPMRWIFTYYNSPDLGWIIMSIKFDDSSDLFFKE